MGNRKQHIFRILQQVKLIGNRSTLAYNLSGGMKHRLNFAISILHDPDILVMDEPTTGLDSVLVAEFWDLINEFKSRGKTIIITSHLMDEIEHNCNQVIMLHQGDVQRQFNMKQLKGHIYDHFVKLTKR